MRISLTVTAAAVALAASVAIHAQAGRQSAAASVQPTFSKEVVRVLAANCMSCHHAGGIAPMPLTTFDETRPHAKAIRDEVTTRSMPPWHAAGERGVFANDPTLSDADMRTLVSWVDAGAPRGNDKELPALPNFTVEWPLGKPDAVLQAAQPYAVDAQPGDEYRCFVMPNPSDADRWVRAVDIRPGDARVVHHAFIWIDRGATAAAMDGRDGKPGYSCFGGPGFNATANLGAWVPGQQVLPLSKGVAYLLPAKSSLVMQVHYHHSGTAAIDRTRIALYFTGSADAALQSVPILNPRFQIPAGAPAYEVRATYTVPEDIDVISVLPHMHLLGQSMEVTATPPGGVAQTLIRVPKYDFNWQRTYTYRAPVSLPKGTRIDVVAVFDNSAGNPSNPNNPPRPVRFGEATTDEMNVAYLSFVPSKR